MTCLKCGAINIDGSSFCIKCGANLKEMEQNVTINNTPIQNEQQMCMQPENQINNQQQAFGTPVAQENQTLNQQTIYGRETIAQESQVFSQANVQQMSPTTNVSESPLNYLLYIINVLIKPFKSFKKEEQKLNDSKTSFILALIVSGGMTIINLIKTIFTTVRVKSFSFTEGYVSTWQWDNLKNIKWVEVIGKNFLIYLCILFAIAIVFYLGSLIIKKQLNFMKILSIASTAVLPAIICGMIISPLAGKVWSPLSIIFMVAGGVYSLLILYELVNDDLKLDGDIKIYFNLICLSILVVAGYYVFMKLFMSSVTSELDGILDLFK